MTLWNLNSFSVGVATPLGLPGQCGKCMHQHSTSGIRRISIRGDTLQNDTWHNVRVWVDFGGLHYDKIRDIRERNVTIRSETWTTNIRSLRFWDIRECDNVGIDIMEFRVYAPTTLIMANSLTCLYNNLPLATLQSGMLYHIWKWFAYLNTLLIPSVIPTSFLGCSNAHYVQSNWKYCSPMWAFHVKISWSNGVHRQ